MEPTPPPSSGQYFDVAPTVALRTSEVLLALPDLTVELTTASGVFSSRAVDPGTKLLLLDGAQPPSGPADLLDLGCGYGPIAIALALRAPEATVWAVEVNQRARALCAANADRAGVADRIRVVDPDGIPQHLRFGGLWSNPPIRVGKPVLHDLLLRWLHRLAPSAVGHLVVQKHLGADSLARWLGDQGWIVRRTGSRMGYRLLDVSAATTAEDS